jgi:biopolymer transport protein ExbB/TolQ
VSKLNALSAALLRSPLLWGGALAFLFFTLVHGGVISDPLVVRYLAGHWVEYAEVTLFCVGLAALAVRGIDLVRQRLRLPDGDILGAVAEGGEDPSVAGELLARVPMADGYLPRRLREGLDLVVRTGSADDLENHLKYLSDVDAARAANGYGLVRFIVWAIPIMGFLGTVIGITVAIASLSPTQLENISGVVAGLGTAFDTTATALALSMVLMFLQFLLDRYEQGLLAVVDEKAWSSLAGRFQSFSGDGSSLAVARLGETLNRGASRLLESQEQAWRALERTTGDAVRQLVTQGSEQFQASLTAALDASLGRWAESLATAHDAHAGRREERFMASAERWTTAAEALSTSVVSLERHQASLGKQTELLENLMATSRDVADLERSLDANLAALSATGRFEETLAALTAAVHLLSARAMARGRDDMDEARRVGKAA